jgi:LPS sulfotransferase NodH
MTFAVQYEGLSPTSEALDFPTGTLPTLCYFVASTRRSGSTHVCDELWRTGLLGAPMEYFAFRNVMVELISRLSVRSLDEYAWRVVEVRTSPNGVFGLKVHYDQYAFMGLSGLLPLFGRPRWIFVRRRDVVAQAVSLAKATQTNQWTSRHVAQKPASYNHKLVLSCFKEIVGQNEAWEQIFQKRKIHPLVLIYEEFIEDPEKSVGRILQDCSIPLAPRAEVDLPPAERQSDQTNLEWAERFRRETADKGEVL